MLDPSLNPLLRVPCKSWWFVLINDSEVSKQNSMSPCKTFNIMGFFFKQDAVYTKIKGTLWKQQNYNFYHTIVVLCFEQDILGRQ